MDCIGLCSNILGYIGLNWAILDHIGQQKCVHHGDIIVIFSNADTADKYIICFLGVSENGGYHQNRPKGEQIGRAHV